MERDDPRDLKLWAGFVLNKAGFFLFPAFLCSNVEAGFGIEPWDFPMWRTQTWRQMRQQNQGIMEWFGLDGTFKTIQFQPFSIGRDTPSWL